MAIKDEYFEAILNLYQRKKKEYRTINMMEFIKETGVERADAFSYFSRNGWKERTVGLFSQY